MTKKVGSTARFGPRYGTKTKKEIAKIEKKQRQKNICPYCERPTLKRIASGIWYCKKCKTKFAGGAYFPKSE
jgi:large subunit ribosomal protein L37Ae